MKNKYKWTIHEIPKAMRQKKHISLHYNFTYITTKRDVTDNAWTYLSIKYCK